MLNETENKLYKTSRDVFPVNASIKAEDSFDLNVTLILNEIKSMLLEKNRKYGNSALEPIRIFSHATAKEQLLVRIDDKLSRIKNRQNDDDEDVISDLIGYLILLKIGSKN